MAIQMYSNHTIRMTDATIMGCELDSLEIPMLHMRLKFGGPSFEMFAVFAHLSRR